MKKRKMNEGNIDADNEETLEPDRRGAEDGGWGRIRSNNGSTRAMKTKGSWAFARRTLSCENPTDPPTIKVTSLTVLAAKQVATIISDKDMRQLAPIHAELIRKTGIKRKREKGEGGASPTKVEKEKEKSTKSKGNQLDNNDDITLHDNNKSRSNATINKEGNDKTDNI
jgi:hypothetical protein